MLENCRDFKIHTVKFLDLILNLTKTMKSEQKSSQKMRLSGNQAVCPADYHCQTVIELSCFLRTQAIQCQQGIPTAVPAGLHTVCTTSFMWNGSNTNLTYTRQSQAPDLLLTVIAVSQEAGKQNLPSQTHKPQAVTLNAAQVRLVSSGWGGSQMCCCTETVSTSFSSNHQPTDSAHLWRACGSRERMITALCQAQTGKRGSV